MRVSPRRNYDKENAWAVRWSYKFRVCYRNRSIKNETDADIGYAVVSL
jgi:hypothetical protein